MTTVYSQIGKFEILRKLGRGGMADVYLAQDAEGQRQVALKVLEIGTDQDSQDALAAERHGAILQSRLCGIDPHVATVYEYGESDRFFFISMEHIEGDDLSTVLRLGPLVPGRAIDIAIEVCSLLVTAHALQLTVEGEPHRSVIHGDIKPRNIRIAPDGRVKVLDFGIAKALSLTRKLTRNDFGSVAYASPERLESGEVDVQSDLWSLGVVLYEMLAGRQPYLEATTRGVSKRRSDSRRTPPPLPPSCPTAVQRVVSRALAPDLARRYPSATDFQADLIALRENRADDCRHRAASSCTTPTRHVVPVRCGLRQLPRRPRRDAADGARAARSTTRGIAAGGLFGEGGGACQRRGGHCWSGGGDQDRQTQTAFAVRASAPALLVVHVPHGGVAGDAGVRRSRQAAGDVAAGGARRHGRRLERFPLAGRSQSVWLGRGGCQEPVRDRLIDFADRIIDSYRTRP